MSDKILSLSNLKTNDPSYLETVFSLANGHFGSRGSNPLIESPSAYTIVNGFYEISPISYGESAYGYAKNNQTIVELPDIRKIQLINSNGRKFKFVKLINQILDMSNGQSQIKLEAENEDNQKLQLNLIQVVDQNNLGLTALRYEILPLNFDDVVTVIHPLNVSKKTTDEFDPRKSNRKMNLQSSIIRKPNEIVGSFTTTESALNVQIALFSRDSKNIELHNGESNVIDYIAYIGRINDLNTTDLNFEKDTFDTIAESTSSYWKEFWKNSEVKISGDSSLNQSINYDIFQLNCSAGKDGKTSISAKGLSGSGYEGHYFWDTEMYMLPFFVYTNPDVAKKLLEYRYSIIPKAQKRARTLGVDKGVLFPWRTIDGEEASAYFPGGTAQYHINGDIAYAVFKYWEATRDIQFMKEYGLKIIAETALFWSNFGSWNGNRFEFFDVTGPDEYTAIVNNNYYTNRIAKFNMQFLYELKDEFSLDQFISIDDLEDMKKKADAVYLPFNKALGINEQDDSAFDKPIWPFESTPKENHPLLLHYHPLNIYRHQVNKQADTLLADYLFDDVDDDQLKKEYEYYEKITTHDSSLSRAIFSILAARMDSDEKAINYFGDSASMDLTDLQGNTDDGLHLANLGGCWLSIVMGFAGMQVVDNELHFNNHLPESWKKLKFKIRFRNRLLKIEIDNENICVSVIEGDPLKIFIGDEESLVK